MTNEIANLETELAPQRSRLDELIAAASFQSVTSSADEEAAIDLVKEGKAVASKIKSMRDFFVKPLKEQVKKINALFDPVIDHADRVEAMLKPKMVAFQTQLRETARKIKEEEDRRIEEARKLQAQTKSPFTEEIPEEEIPTAPVVEKTTRTWSGSKATYVEKVKGKVVDFAALPDDYKLADEAKINRAVQAGVTIPGVEVYKELQSRIS